MTPFNQVLFEDVKAIRKAFDEDDFGLMNILSNRVISNGILVETEKNYIPGFFYKEVALTFQRLQYEKSDVITTTKSICIPILSDMEKYFIEDKKAIDYWAKYLEFHIKTRKLLIKDIEKDVYTNNIKFTDSSFKWLLSFLEENKLLLKKKDNQLFRGILNEMNRVMRCHSAKIEHIIISTLIQSLDNLYLYILYEDDDVYNKIDRFMIIFFELVKKELDPEKSHDLLKMILIEWRKYYIKYMDVAVERKRLQRGYIIPKEVKEKLSESISKTLEDEIETEDE